MVDFEFLKLERHKSDILYVQYLSALNKFVETHLPEIKHTHVFVTGSFVKGKLHPGSDLDIDIVHPDIKETIVKKIDIDGIIVEYATFSFEMIEKKLKGEIEYDRPDLLANAVSHWKMIVGNEFPDRLVEQAKKFKK